MNPMKFLHIKSAMSQFEKRHPKLPQFLQVIKTKALKEGTVVEIKVTTPEGETLITNMKLTEEDVQLLKEGEQGLHKR